MVQLGLSLSIWDQQLRCIQDSQAELEFCHLVCNQDPARTGVVQELVSQVLTYGEPKTRTTPMGCCIIAVPIKHRRRTLGAAVACYPSIEMTAEEAFARACDQLHLDRKALLEPASRACRHSAAEAYTFMQVISWLLEQEQALGEAQSELALLGGNLSDTYEELNLVYRISGAIRLTRRPGGFLKDICQELVDVMGVSAAAAIVSTGPAGETGATNDMIVRSGEITISDTELLELAHDVLLPRLETSSRVIVDNVFVGSPGSNVAAALSNMLAVPLGEDAATKTPLGVLVAMNKTGGDFDSVDAKLINAIGSQAGVFLSNHRLYDDLQQLLMGVMNALTSSIDAKDPYTRGHSQRVAMVSHRLALEAGFPTVRAQRIYLAGLLHDIGKIGVPESVLCKPGRLTEAEFDLIRRHPTVGAKILSGIRQLDDLRDAVLGHHERPDGLGYPAGLKGDQVPIEGLIVGLADTFDAMTSDRTYRRALPLEVVVDEIRRYSGTQFDPQLAECLLSMDLESLLEEMRGSDLATIPGDVLDGGWL